MHVARLGERAQHRELGGRAAASARTARSAAGAPPPRAPRAAARTPPRAARPGRARRSARAAAATAPPATRSRPRPRPSPAAARAAAARSGRTGPARWRIAAKRRARRDSPRRCARGARRNGSPSDSPTTSSSGHTIRSGSHGSASASKPEAAATASSVSRRGDGKSTLAQIPSRSEIRCVSQRSIPRVGTHTTSAANGSSSGAASSPRSASTRPSARSDRWRWSIHRMVERAADVLTAQAAMPSSFFFASTSMPCSFARFSPRILRFACSVSWG